MLFKKAMLVLHDIFIVFLGILVVGLLVVAPLTALLQNSGGAVAPVVVRPKIDSPILPKLQPTSMGIAFGDTLRSLSPHELDTQLNDVASLGFKWVRIDIDWSAVQPLSQKEYSWAAYDRIINKAHEHSLQVLATIAYAPKWARQPECAESDKCAPASNAVYAAFAKVTVGRYSPKGVKAWEVWNEPNIPQFWQPQPQPSQYADMLKKTYKSIKSADPKAIVVSAGLAPAEDEAPRIAPRSFLGAMYVAGARGSFDALGYHPYSYPAPPNVAYSWSGWSQMADLTTSLRTIMVANGDGDKAIWITEIGVPTGGSGVTATPANFRYHLSTDHSNEQLQALVARQAIDAVNNAAWAGPMFWYSYKDLGTDRSSNENFFGIREANGRQKQIYSTFKEALKDAR